MSDLHSLTKFLYPLSLSLSLMIYREAFRSYSVIYSCSIPFGACFICLDSYLDIWLSLCCYVKKPGTGILLWRTFVLVLRTVLAQKDRKCDRQELAVVSSTRNASVCVCMCVTFSIPHPAVLCKWRKMSKLEANVIWGLFHLYTSAVVIWVSYPPSFSFLACKHQLSVA